VQKIYYLPESSTDMIFAIIGEELGLLGVLAVLGAFALLGYAGFNIALRCRDPFGKRLAAGLTALICGQAAVNISAVMGLAPLTGVPLPFVSYGGSSLVVGLASVGMLLNIAVNHGAAPLSEVPDRRRRNRRPRSAGARGGRGAPVSRRPRRLRVER
jgi:cell division protein FtsW